MRKVIVLTAILVISALFVTAPCMSAGDGTKNVLKDAIVGAGTGAIAAGATGGKAGTGALIGAGTGAVGGILMDVITEPSSPAPQQQAATDESITTQEVFHKGYEKGYRDGFNAGFKEGLEQAN